MKIEPMLAERKFPNLSKLRYPLYASPKIDGVRALEVKEKIVSRNLELFPNRHVHTLFDRPELEGLDGELVVGSPTDQQLRNTTSGRLNSPDGEPDFKFYVFDVWNSNLPFSNRWHDILHQRALGVPNVEIVHHQVIESEQQLLEYEDACLKKGYEGLILRAPEGPYKYGRSTMREGWMLKLKRFKDAEARVLRVNEEMKNNNPAKKNKLGRTKRSSSKKGKVGKGRAGELEVVGINGRFEGVEFVVPLGGAGDAGKAWWWEQHLAGTAAGRIVTYKFFEHGVKDKPLLTTYVGVREDWDQS